MSESVYRVTEVVGVSSESWEAAANGTEYGNVLGCRRDGREERTRTAGRGGHSAGPHDRGRWRAQLPSPSRDLVQVRPGLTRTHGAWSRRQAPWGLRTRPPARFEHRLSEAGPVRPEYSLSRRARPATISQVMRSRRILLALARLSPLLILPALMFVFGAQCVAKLMEDIKAEYFRTREEGIAVGKQKLNGVRPNSLNIVGGGRVANEGLKYRASRGRIVDIYPDIG